MQNLKGTLSLNDRIGSSFSRRAFLVKFMLLCPNYSAMKSRMSDSLRCEFLNKSCDPTEEQFRLVPVLPRIPLVKDLSISHFPGSRCQETLVRCRYREAEKGK